MELWFGNEPFGSSGFTYSGNKPLNQEFEKMNKKLLLGVLCIAVIAVAGASVLADTYFSKKVKFYINSGGSQDICLFNDCWAQSAASDWTQPVTEGNTYEYAIYVLNVGTEQVYITYLPTDINKDTGQTRFHITVNVIEFGMTCQMDGQVPRPTGFIIPYALPEKNTANPTAGFVLAPNKMIKLDISLRVDAVDLNTKAWDFDFEVISCTV
jgi:hypothetical protein